MTKRIGTMLATIAVVTAGGAAYFRTSGAEQASPVLTAEVSRGAVVRTVDATGTLEAVETVEVGTQVSGTIKALYVDFNSRVRKGQVVAQLDPSLIQAQVEQARATVQRLKAEVDNARVQVDDTRRKLQRAQELMTRQLIPATDLETAQADARRAEASLRASEAQLVQGQASLNQALVNLGHTTIAAPIDGVVISRNVDVGQTVAASMQAPTLFVIARDLGRMRVNASIDEADIGRIEPAQRAQFRVDAYPDKTFTGTVQQVRLQPVVEQNVVSYVTVIEVPNPDLTLKPGMTATVTIEIARADDVLRVPNAALRFRPTAEVFAAFGQEPGAWRGNAEGADADRVAPGSANRGSNAGARTQGGAAPLEARRAGSGVWVVKDGRLHRVPVETGIDDGTVTAVIGGDLAPGVQVVTGGAISSTTASSSSGSPLLPQRPARNRAAAAQGGR